MLGNTLCSTLFLCVGLLSTALYAADNASQEAASSLNSMADDVGSRGTKRKNENNKESPLKMRPQQDIRIQEPQVILQTDVFGLNVNKQRVKVAKSRHRIARALAEEYSPTLKNLIEAAKKNNYDGPIELPEFTTKQLNDVVTLIQQAAMRLQNQADLPLKAQSIDDLIELTKILLFLDMLQEEQPFFKNILQRKIEQQILHMSPDELNKLLAKLQSSNDITEPIMDMFIRRIQEKVGIEKNMRHLQGSDGSTISMPTEALDILFPLLQQLNLTTPSEPIAFNDLTRPQLEDLAHLAIKYGTLQKSIKEEDSVKKEKNVIEALSDLPLAMVPTQVSALSLDSLKTNLSPELVSVLKEMGIQQLLEGLPVKVEMDESKVDQSFINMIITLNKYPAHKDIIQAVGRQWVKYIEKTSNAFKQKEARLQRFATNNPFLHEILSESTTVHAQELLTSSIAELIDREAIPAPQRGKLDLSNKKINSLDGLMAIPGIQDIRILFLHNNKIRDIKGAFDNLLQLQGLNLSNNQINDIKGVFGKLPQLQGLALENNQIREIQGAFNKLPQLQKLWLANNQINDIKGAFDKLPQLQKLWLKNNQINDIKGAFDKLPQLQGLDLTGNQINDIKGVFDKLPQLQKLGLSRNQIREIQGAFDKLPQLQGLDLTGNQINEIKGAFDKLPQLQRLWLTNNQINDIKGAFDKLPQLQGLDLTVNQINEIKGAFDKLPQLQVLSLGINQIRNIQGAFNKLPQLQKLWIFGNQLTPAQEEELRVTLPNATIYLVNPSGQ